VKPLEKSKKERGDDNNCKLHYPTPLHFGPGNLADGKKTDCPENDQINPRAAASFNRPSDIEIENAHGHHLVSWNHKRSVAEASWRARIKE